MNGTAEFSGSRLKGDPSQTHRFPVMSGFPPPQEWRVTTRNWEEYPYNRWAFQNMQSIMPTARIGRNPQEYSILSHHPRELGGVRLPKIDGSFTTVDQLLDDTYTDGFIVLHKGRVVEERYFGDMLPSTLHMSQSVGKSFVGTLAGILVERGILDPEAPIAEYVPELARGGYGDATVRNILDMTSGIAFKEEYGVAGSDVEFTDKCMGWRGVPEPGEPACMTEYIQTLGKQRPHGLHFQYRSIETDMLGWVLERAAQAKLSSLMGQLLWAPLGAEYDAAYIVDPSGFALASGGINATLRDYARFGQMMVDGGYFNSRQIVPTAWVEDCSRADLEKFVVREDSIFTGRPNSGYRNQWWVVDRDLCVLLAIGVFGQMLYVNPASSLVIVKLSSYPMHSQREWYRNTLNGFEAIGKELGADH